LCGVPVTMEHCAPDTRQKDVQRAKADEVDMNANLQTVSGESMQLQNCTAHSCRGLKRTCSPAQENGRDWKKHVGASTHCTPLMIASTANPKGKLWSYPAESSDVENMLAKCTNVPAPLVTPPQLLLCPAHTSTTVPCRCPNFALTDDFESWHESPTCSLNQANGNACLMDASIPFADSTASTYPEQCINSPSLTASTPGPLFKAIGCEAQSPSSSAASQR
jgi:hypothetical protein